jgi:hypothetical protein
MNVTRFHSAVRRMLDVTFAVVIVRSFRTLTFHYLGISGGAGDHVW